MAAKAQPNRKFVEIDVGRDYSSYGTLKIRLPEDEITEAHLKEIVDTAVSDFEYNGQPFDLVENYDTGHGLRIITVKIQGEESDIRDVSLEENPYTLGYATQEFLKGNDDENGFAKLLESAVKSGMMRPIEMVTMSGEMEFGGEFFTAEFQVRKGATPMEKDHAFMCALAQQATFTFTEVSATEEAS